jgi:hypothetical protein
MSSLPPSVVFSGSETCDFLFSSTPRAFAGGENTLISFRVFKGKGENQHSFLFMNIRK